MSRLNSMDLEPADAEAQLLIPLNSKEDEEKGQEEQEEDPITCKDITMKIMTNPFQMLPIVAMVAITVIGAVFFLTSLVNGWGLCETFLIISTVANVGATGYVVSLGGMAYQLERFKEQNKVLASTTDKMSGQVSVFDDANQKLRNKMDSIESTIRDLKGLNDDLSGQLDGFGELRSAIESKSQEMGKDFEEFVNETNRMYEDMKGFNQTQDRVLLLRIAQDLEFMDRQQGMQKMEFERFMLQVPQHMQPRFKELGVTFESVAGSDGVIDHNELAALVEQVLKESPNP